MLRCSLIFFYLLRRCITHSAFTAAHPHPPSRLLRSIFVCKCVKINTRSTSVEKSRLSSENRTLLFIFNGKIIFMTCSVKYYDVICSQNQLSTNKS